MTGSFGTTRVYRRCHHATGTDPAGVCIGRFIAVSIPLNYNRRQIDLRQLILISTTWIFAFAVASPVIFGLNNVPNRDPSLCQLEDDNYIVYSSICSFFIPCPVMLVLYCAMFQGLRRWEEARKAKLRGSIYGPGRKLYQPAGSLEREQPGLGPARCGSYACPAHPGDYGVNSGLQTVSYPHLQYPPPRLGRKRAKINGREQKAMRVLPVVVGEWRSGGRVGHRGGGRAGHVRSWRSKHVLCRLPSQEPRCDERRHAEIPLSPRWRRLREIKAPPSSSALQSLVSTLRVARGLFNSPLPVLLGTSRPCPSLIERFFIQGTSWSPLGPNPSPGKGHSVQCLSPNLLLKVNLWLPIP